MVNIRANKGFETSYTDMGNGVLKVDFQIHDWQISNVEHDGQQFSSIIFGTTTVTNKKGWAELPFVSAGLQLPSDRNVDLKVVNVQYSDIQLTNPILPSRGVIYRNQNPEEIPYTIDKASLVDEFYPADIVTMDEPFIVRDVRGTAIRVFPFQYNPITKILRVYQSVEVEVVENNQTPTNELKNANYRPVKEMVGLYEQMFINFDKSRYDLNMAEYGEILVITTQRDHEAIQPYIQWKREKGFVVYEEIVNTGTNVKNLIQNSYDNNNNILYVQLVGDWNDVKVDNSIMGSPVDPKMGCVNGTDNFPDIAIGRFSCNNPAQLTVQVNKAIEYEKNPNTLEGWRDAFAGIGSEQGAGSGDDGETDYDHVQTIYTDKLQPTFNYTTHYENYGVNPSVNNLIQAINNGVSTIAYCGHGSEVSWITTGFSNNNISQLTNADKLPFIVSVACVNGAYDGSGDCFAEAWLKKENGGAVVTWMSTINQPWAPPQRGQDYFYDILIGGYNYDEHSGQNGINTTEQRTTWGALTVNALNLMLTESQTSEDINTAHTWATFGDVSLQLRTTMPQTIQSSNDLMLIGVPFETTITTADGTPVSNALVCVSKDGKYYSSITDENGFVSLENDFEPGEVKMVVTGFNTTTIYQTINCIAPDGPYLLLSDYSTSEPLVFGQTAGLNLAIRNVGVENAQNVIVSISSEDEFITFPTQSANIPSITSNDTMIAESILSVAVAGNIPDQHVALCNVTMTCGEQSWTGEIELQASAPAVELASFGYEGQLLPGQTLNITATFKNTGAYPVENAFATYTQTSPYVTVLSTEPVALGTIDNDGTNVTTQFTITVSADAPFGTIIPSTIIINGDDNFSYEAYFEPFIDICNVAISTFPHSESFDAEEIPNCWTQEVVSGEGLWTTQKGGLMGHPQNAHSGPNNAFISGINKVRLVSPLINLSNTENATLTFWHAQSVQSGKQDKLRIYYKNTTDGEWVLLKEYLYSNASWKERTLELPNVSANYYVAFEAECNGGFGVVLDDVQINASNAAAMPGDVNNDGVVNVLDVTTTINHTLGFNPDPFNADNADINGDNVIDILDVVAIVNIITQR